MSLLTLLRPRRKTGPGLLLALSPPALYTAAPVAPSYPMEGDPVPAVLVVEGEITGTGDLTGFASTFDATGFLTFSGISDHQILYHGFFSATFGGGTGAARSRMSGAAHSFAPWGE